MAVIKASDMPSDLRQMMDERGIHIIRACRGDLREPLATEGVRRIVEEVIGLDAKRRGQPNADADEKYSGTSRCTDLFDPTTAAALERSPVTTRPSVQTAQAVIHETHRMLVEAATLGSAGLTNYMAVSEEDRLSHHAQTYIAQGVRLHTRLPWVALATALGVTADATPVVEDEDAAGQIISIAADHADQARKRTTNQRPIPVREPGAAERIVEREARKCADRAFIDTLAALGVTV
ncbi:hypothetical protein ACGFI9_21735 [Micromonospora sp. NPDC048930]|uniref:hypothetical protein n=1 Tax=Micromonospora sp. NPDC048930 TaxID=3364261 RepID=UPI00371F46AF